MQISKAFSSCIYAAPAPDIARSQSRQPRGSAAQNRPVPSRRPLKHWLWHQEAARSLLLNHAGRNNPPGGARGCGGAAPAPAICHDPTSIWTATACILSARTCRDATGRAANCSGSDTGRHGGRFSFRRTSERPKDTGDGSRGWQSRPAPEREGAATTANRPLTTVAAAERSAPAGRSRSSSRSFCSSPAPVEY